MISQRIILFMILCFALILFTDCNKEDQPEIVVPGSYFPVYPGSWWKYRVNNTMEIIDSTAKDYISYSYTIDDVYHNIHYSSTDLVPWYYASAQSPVGITGPIFKYDHIDTHKWFGTYFWPILSEEIGYEFSEHMGDQYPEMIEIVTVKEKKFDGQDSILILEGRYEWWYEPYDSIMRIREFTKDIGLTSDIGINPFNNDTVWNKVLIDYHIEW
jgi:hypothetical protein